MVAWQAQPSISLFASISNLSFVAQQFINPVELLGLSTISPDAIDSVTVKKARRRLLADLDLSDGYHTYHGQQIDRSACEQACADLDYPEKLRAWHSLANQPALGLFLTSGRLDFLLNPPLNVRFLKQDKDLLALIGQRYASQFDHVLLQAFESDDVELLQGLEDAPALYAPSLSAIAYRGVTRAMRRQIDAIDELVKLLDEEDDEEEANAALDEAIYGCYNAVNLNTLPDAGFEGLRSEFALSVRSYAVKLFNTFFETSAPTRLLQEVADIAIDEQTADRIQEDIQQIGQIEENNRLRARQEEFAGRVGKAFEQLMAYQKQIDAGSASITAVQQWAVGLKPLFQQLNAETDKDSSMFREAMAQGMRSLSVSIWNKNQANGKVALAVLDSGLSLTIPADTRAKLQADKQQLTRMVNDSVSAQAVAPLRTTARTSSAVNSSKKLFKLIGPVAGC